jgi:hypothetical protein
MYTRCPAIHAALNEKRRRKAEVNDLSCDDRCFVQGQPMFLPHKPGVIAYAGRTVARLRIQAMLTTTSLPYLSYISF